MNKKNPDYWKINLTDKMKNQLDEELIEDLNEQYPEEEEEESRQDERRRRNRNRLIGAITAIFFILLAFTGWLRVLQMPSLDFVKLSRELAQNPEISQLREAVVVVHALGRQGTGFNIDEDGVLITNHHVIEQANLVYVNFFNGDLYLVSKIESFPALDLAILYIDAENLPVIPLAVDKAVALGDEVLIIGNPLGFSRVIHQGKVLGTTKLAGWDDDVIMIEGDIYKGSSGSPVFNEDGEVIAVVFAAIDKSMNPDIEKNIGFAVPIEHLFRKEVLSD